MDLEAKLQALITAMQKKRSQTGPLKGQDLREFRQQCDWYVEGVRDALQVVKGEKPYQVQL